MQFSIEAIAVNNEQQNYIWMLIDQEQQLAVAIDPYNADLVLNYCADKQLQLTQIWITHKHKDHIGGLSKLRQYTEAKIYAPAVEKEAIVTADFWLEDDAQFTFSGLNISVIATTGHTLGHICYFIDALDSLFCGDTLFAMGCGRVFEGTYEQMYAALNRLAALPPRTKVYCTHEYTQSNAEFALSVEPDNSALQQRYEDVKILRAENKITLPSTIELELQTNPFLRTQNVHEFAHIRRLKDQF